jgi:hypothetical protein
MRISILLSMVVITFSLIGNAQAQLQVPQSLSGCGANAPDQASQDCYSGIQDCYTNSSGNEQSWQNCIGVVESAYLAAQNPGASESSASTQQGILVPAESDYYDIDGAKGWENTNQP